MHNHPSVLKICLSQIEDSLGWGSSLYWKNSDFEVLSEKIFQRTGVTLSTSTLRRLWGKVKYDSEPQVSTLNALARFLGYESFRDFNDSIRKEAATEEAESTVPEKREEPIPQKKTGSRSSSKLLFIAAFISVLLVGWIVIDQDKGNSTDTGTFSFSSQPVTSGVPNSVVFEVDALGAATDSLFIQQSWDSSKRFKIDKNQKQATSVYYYPGYFRAKLVVGEETVREHDLLIASDGWLTLVENDPVPVYFKKEETIKDGKLGLSENDLLRRNIKMQPELPVSKFYYVADFGSFSSDSFQLETNFRNTYSEGSGACQFSQVVVLCENSAFMIPVSIPGCSSELSVFLGGEGIDGKKADLSGFGVNSGEWAEMQVSVVNKEVKIRMADRLVLQESFTGNVGNIVGLAFFFQGIGEIDFVRLYDVDQKTVLEEEF